MEPSSRCEGDEVSGGGLNSKLQTSNFKSQISNLKEEEEEEDAIQRRDASGTDCAGTAQLPGRKRLLGYDPVFVFLDEGFHGPIVREEGD